MILKSLIGIILVFCSLTLELSAQNWRFPNCDDLEITLIKFDGNRDTLIIEVFNNCDTCVQHVYTGLMAFNKQDTLAASFWLFSHGSPLNNSSMTYYLESQQQFEITDINRIEMVGGICDSIPITNNSSSISTNEAQEKIRIFPNPSNGSIKISHPGKVQIQFARIIDINGKTHKIIEGDFSVIKTTGLSKGIYFVFIQTDQKILTRQLVIN